MINNSKLLANGWSGLIPPQFLLREKKFKKVVLEPPDYNPGSWRGAGKTIRDYDTGEYWMTTRPRKAPPARGYAVEIYKSKTGEDFTLVHTITKEELSEMTGFQIKSIEGQQILRDPTTGRYHLYLSVDNIGTHPLQGWDTILLVADDPKGPWEYKGFALKRGLGFDCREARDSTIDIIDGLYVAIYKANDGSRVNMALAVSMDGFNWKKLGILKLNNGAQPGYLLLCGKILAGTLSPVFIGFENRVIVRGAAVTDTFSSYILDIREKNLIHLFSGRWEPQSPYERKDYPIHSYFDMVYDPDNNRILMYVEAIDPSNLGLNEEVDRVLLYEVKIP